MIKLYHGDCLVEMNKIADNSINAVICDLPYNKTVCGWDQAIIPLEEMWKQVIRVTKTNSNIILTSAQPFTSLLIVSQPKLFKYEIIWKKKQGTAAMLAKIRPIPIHENILVFYNNLNTYNPQMTIGTPYKGFSSQESTIGEVYGEQLISKHSENEGIRYPVSVIEYGRERGEKWDGKHPTQKPLSLMKWLVSTYTNPHDIILDPTMGSGTTGAACVELGRSFIGIEKEEKFFKIAQKRLSEISSQIRMSDFV